MKKIIYIAAVAALPALAQSVRFDITVVSGGQTNQAVLNITNTAAATVVALATNKVPTASNPAEAVKAVTKSRLKEVVNEAIDAQARSAAANAAEAAANAVLNAAQNAKIQEVE